MTAADGAPGSGSLRPGVHSHGQVGLGQGRSVIGAVANHGNHVPVLLIFPNGFQLHSRSGLGQVIVNTGLRCNSGGG